MAAANENIPALNILLSHPDIVVDLQSKVLNFGDHNTLGWRDTSDEGYCFWKV